MCNFRQSFVFFTKFWIFHKMFEFFIKCLIFLQSIEFLQSFDFFWKHFFFKNLKLFKKLKILCCENYAVKIYYQIFGIIFEFFTQFWIFDNLEKKYIKLRIISYDKKSENSKIITVSNFLRIISKNVGKLPKQIAKNI